MVKRIFASLILLSIFFFFLCNKWGLNTEIHKNSRIIKKPIEKIVSPLTIETVKGKSGEQYIFIYKNSAKIDFEIQRPDLNDSTVFLSIAGTFTTLDSFSIDGFYIWKGKTSNKSKINHSLGGAVKITDGECEIFPTENGRRLNDSLISSIIAKNGSLFQQIQCIENGIAASFKDKQLFQRRGIVIMKIGRAHV